MTMHGELITGADTALGDINFEALMGQLYNQPLLASEAMADYLRVLTGQRFRLTETMARAMSAPGYGVGDDRKHYAFKDGVATLSVRGMLLHRSHAYYSFATGYDALKALHDAAQDDPDVEGIVWDFASGGGMVSGLLDFADSLYGARGKKPAIAVVNDHAYSAAYALASAVGNIHVTRSGGVGSIGAVAVLWNFAKALDDVGVKAEVIRSAPRKMKPNAIEPLEKEDRDRVQADIDHIADIFVAMVARNTGVGEDVIRGTEAGTLRAEEAVAMGLAHQVMSVDDAIDSFHSELSGSTINRGIFMTTQAKAGDQVTGMFTQADMDAATTTAKAQGITEGKALGAEAENTRILGILTLEETKGREAAAMALAKNPAMSVDSAKEFLAAIPATKPEAHGESLSHWMQQTGGGAGVAAGESGDAVASEAPVIDHAKIYGALNSAHKRH